MKRGWAQRFDVPIPLPDGGTLATLDDARAHILALPPDEQQTRAWQIAAGELLQAASPPGRGPWIDFARIAMMQALLKDTPRTFNATPKDPTWRRYKLKRDR